MIHSNGSADRFARAWRGGLLVPAALVLTLALAACSSKDSEPVPVVPTLADSVTFHGVMAGSGGDAGTLTLALSLRTAPGRGAPTAPSIERAASVYDVYAVFIFGPTRVPATGTYDTATGQITAASAGYTLVGTLVSGRFGGTYTRTSPTRSGGFVAIPFDGAAPLPYLGSWSGTGTLGGDYGSLSFMLDGALVYGVARNDDGTLGAVEGSYAVGSGDITMSYPSYVFTGLALSGSAAGTYTSTLDGGRAGNWTTTSSGF